MSAQPAAGPGRRQDAPNREQSPRQCRGGVEVLQRQRNAARNRNRASRVLHRKPGAKDWDEVSLDWAMDRVVALVKKTRDETFVEHLEDGTQVNHTTAIFALGGATLDNEWNHLQQKLMRGLGVVPIENQARI